MAASDKPHVRFAAVSGVGLVALLGVAMLAVAVFLQFQSQSDTSCEKVNHAVDYIDHLVQYSTRSVDDPRPLVADPKVQELIDKGRQQALDLREYSRVQSRMARCKPGG